MASHEFEVVRTKNNERKGKRAELPDDIAKRLKSCSVAGCEDWRDLAAYTTYHCFPTGDKNQERWEIWTQLLRKARLDDAWIPYRGSLVCSHHFKETDFVNDPLSKRRKLMKNAIPSVFPEFSVDIEDPVFQLSDDQDQTGGADGIDEDNSYDLNCSEEYAYINDSKSLLATGLYNQEDIIYQYQKDDEAVDSGGDDDIQVINDSGKTKYIFKENKASTSRQQVPLPIIQLPAEIPKNIRILSTSQISIPPKPPRKAPPPPPQLIAISNTQKQGQRKSTFMTAEPNSAFNTGTSLQSRSLTSSSLKPKATRPLASALTASVLHKEKISFQEETAKAFNELPFGLNPDLEIEIIDPAEDLAACRLRINELEQENKSLVYKYENALETLKQKYESQIITLRKRLKNQDYFMEAEESLISTKKARLA